jgi:hypothetical protein
MTAPTHADGRQARGGDPFLAAAQRRIRLEIEACAAVCAYVADVPDDLTPDVFRFDDTRLIFATAVHEGIPELPRRLRAAGYWRAGPDPLRELDSMRYACDWSFDLLLKLCGWPRGNARRCASALIQHHRATRDAAAYLARAGELLGMAGGAVGPVTDLLKWADERTHQPRRVA